MTSTTRRDVLAGAAAAAGAAMASAPLPRAARAASPAADTQAAGFYRYMVGSVQITVITATASTDFRCRRIS
jgi:hypothetical protein